MSKMMTDAEFVKREGLCCPHCRATEVDAGDPEFSNYCGSEITIAMTCKSCEYEYVEVFKMTGYLDK